MLVAFRCNQIVDVPLIFQRVVKLVAELAHVGHP